MASLVMASQGVYAGYQGEGMLTGEPTIFVRLGGCSVGCDNCDTNYTPFGRRDVGDLAAAAARLRGREEWASITGGEPADQAHLPELGKALQAAGFRVSLATSGMRHLPACVWWCDWLTVSPHGPPEGVVVREGNELRVVPGLNGFWPGTTQCLDLAGEFSHCWLSPLMEGGKPVKESMKACLDLLRELPGWRLGCQAHVLWGLP